MAVSRGATLVVYALATTIGIAVAAVAWRHREKTGAIPLAMVLLGSVLFSGPRFVATAVDVEPSTSRDSPRSRDSHDSRGSSAPDPTTESS